MANVTGFNHDLDKITERELVYDIYSRVKSGKDLIIKNEIYFENNTSFSAEENNGKESIIFSKGINIKDIDKKILSTIDTNILNNLKKNDEYNYLKVAKIKISPGNNNYRFKESYTINDNINIIIYHTDNNIYYGTGSESESLVINNHDRILKFNENPKCIKVLVFHDSHRGPGMPIIVKAYFESNHIDISKILSVGTFDGGGYIFHIDLTLDDINFTNDDYLRIYYK